MTFATSTSPDITEGLPANLSAQQGAAATSKRGQVQWDISVGGIGFNLGIDDQHQYVRESAPVQKQQTDVSQDAGEQTLDGLWIRSQTSWHLGAGANFYEPGARDGLTPTAYRFDSSAGVDVWNEGDLTLLKKMNQIESSSKNWRACAVGEGGGGYIVTDGTTLKRYNLDGTLKWSTAAFLDGTGGLSCPPVIVNDKVMVADAKGIWSAPVTTGASPTLLWTTTGDFIPCVFAWVKGRIIASRVGQVYELTTAGGNMLTQTAIITKDPTTVFRQAVEAPSAILLPCYEAAGKSAVYSLTLETNTSGATPKLGQPFQVAELPAGEQLIRMESYLGSYIVMCTSLGVRIGLVGDNGQIQYGPLTVKGIAKGVAFYGSFAYVVMGGYAVDGKPSSVVRINLGAPISNGGVYAWANDAVVAENTTAFDVCVINGQVLYTSSLGVKLQSLTAYEPSGYLLSGSIRYGTTESKAFRYADVRCRTKDGGSVGLSIVGPTGEEVPLVSLSGGSTGSNLSLASLAQRLEYISYKLTLTPSSGNSPVVESVALKAVPAVKKQRMIQYPVMMQEKQHDATKAPLRRDIPALIVDMEALEETQAVVTVKDYRTGESFPATIESFRFEGSTPSSGSRRGGANVGGRGTLTVRKL